MKKRVNREQPNFLIAWHGCMHMVSTWFRPTTSDWTTSRCYFSRQTHPNSYGRIVIGDIGSTVVVGSHDPCTRKIYSKETTSSTTITVLSYHQVLTNSEHNTTCKWRRGETSQESPLHTTPNCYRLSHLIAESAFNTNLEGWETSYWRPGSWEEEKDRQGDSKWSSRPRSGGMVVHG